MFLRQNIREELTFYAYWLRDAPAGLTILHSIHTVQGCW